MHALIIPYENPIRKRISFLLLCCGTACHTLVRPLHDDRWIRTRNKVTGKSVFAIPFIFMQKMSLRGNRNAVKIKGQ